MTKWIDLIVQPDPIQVYSQDFERQIELREQEIAILKQIDSRDFIQQLESLFWTHSEAKLLFCSTTKLKENSFWWSREEKILATLSGSLSHRKISAELARRLENEFLTLLKQYLDSKSEEKRHVPKVVISMIGRCLYGLLKHIISSSTELSDCKLTNKQTLFEVVFPILLQCFPDRQVSKSDKYEYIKLVNNLIGNAKRLCDSSEDIIQPTTFLSFAGYYVQYLSEQDHQSIGAILMEYLNLIGNDDTKVPVVLIPHVIISIPSPTISELGEQILLEFLKYKSNDLSEHQSSLLKFHCYLCWKSLITDYVVGSARQVITRIYHCPPLNELNMVIDDVLNGSDLVSCGAFHFFYYVNQNRADLFTSEQKIAVTNRVFNQIDNYSPNDLRWWMMDLKKQKESINLDSNRLQSLTNKFVHYLKKYIAESLEDRDSVTYAIMMYTLEALVIALNQTELDVPDSLVQQLYESIDLVLDHPEAESLLGLSGELVRLMEVTYRRYPSDRAWKPYEMVYRNALKNLFGVNEQWFLCYLSILETNLEKFHSSKELEEQFIKILDDMKATHQNLESVKKRIENLKLID